MNSNEDDVPNSVPPWVPNDETLLPLGGEFFEICRSPIASHDGVIESVRFSFSEKWGHVLRATLRSSVAENQSELVSRFVCWIPPGEAQAKFFVGPHYQR